MMELRETEEIRQIGALLPNPSLPCACRVLRCAFCQSAAPRPVRPVARSVAKSPEDNMAGCPASAARDAWSNLGVVSYFGPGCKACWEWRDAPAQRCVLVLPGEWSVRQMPLALSAIMVPIFVEVVFGIWLSWALLQKRSGWCGRSVVCGSALRGFAWP